METFDPDLGQAIGLVRRFVAETTGEAPTDAELARALSRYFVLREIMENVELGRRDGEESREAVNEPGGETGRRTS